jgi:hypothetical protein
MANAMAKALTIDEIKSRYDNEWVLLGDPVTDEHRRGFYIRLLFGARGR